MRLCSLFVASYDSQGLRWKYSNQPPHGVIVHLLFDFKLIYNLITHNESCCLREGLCVYKKNRIFKNNFVTVFLLRAFERMSEHSPDYLIGWIKRSVGHTFLIVTLRTVVQTAFVIPCLGYYNFCRWGYLFLRSPIKYVSPSPSMKKETSSFRNAAFSSYL
jgi:hypothetical protein